MKKILLSLLLLATFCFGLYLIIGIFIDTEPPLPTITAGDKKVSVSNGSYCWDNFLTSVCADSGPPSHIANNPLSVSPETKLKVNFKSEPEENSLSIYRWVNGESVTIALDNDVIIAPSEKGLHVYSISGNWEKGSASYVFAIEVE